MGRYVAGRDVPLHYRMQPKVFLIGGGPGDPELITVRGARLLGAVDAVLYDALAHPDLLALCRPDCERIFVGKRAGRPTARQETIHARMLELVRRGRSVARLKGGDPTLFARGGEEADFLAAHGIPFEIVPGVTSPLGAAACAGILLTDRSASNSVAVVTAVECGGRERTTEDWARVATATDTLVLLMGRRRLRAWLDELITHGRDPSTPAALIENATLPTQRTFAATLSTLAETVGETDSHGPSLVIVGATVAQRQPRQWFESRPLFGRRVLVPRPEGQASDLVRSLRDQGASVIATPVVRVVSAEDSPEVAQAIARLATYDAVAFTSTHAVDGFMRALVRTGLDVRALAGRLVVAVGPATRRSLERIGIHPDLEPRAAHGSAVAEALLRCASGPRHILLPRARVARPELPAALRAAGRVVDEVTVYETLGPSPEVVASLRDDLAVGLDAAILTSPSIAEHLARAAEGLRLPPAVVIGKTTAAAATELGYTVLATASEASDDGLLMATLAALGPSP